MENTTKSRELIEQQRKGAFQFEAQSVLCYYMLPKVNCTECIVDADIL
jgi:hypothetical protein